MSWKHLPVNLEELSEEETSSLKVRGVQDNNRRVRTSPGGILLPFAYTSLANNFYNFEFRRDDIVVSTYPKSGTVWMAETLWAMTHFDEIHTMEDTHINSRTFFLDLDILHPVSSEDKTPLLKKFQDTCPDGQVKDGIILQLAKADKNPRILKTHLHLQLLNPNLLETSKVVYVARNPKDACVSLYYFFSNRPDMMVDCDFSEFTKLFMDDKMIFSPYWGHLHEAWNLREHPNFHFVFYEDMKDDIMKELKRLREFLMVDLSDDQLKIVKETTNFENMKRRDASRPLMTKMEGSFFRKGAIGDWKTMSSPELDTQMNRWIEENTKNFDITFKYD